MKKLLNIREKLQAFVEDYSAYVLPVLKFALALVVYVLINNKLGYLAALNKLYLLIIFAAISALLPLNGTVLIGMTLIIAHCFGLGVETGLFALVLYLVLVLLYFRFVSRDSLVLLLTPFAGMFHVQATVPLCLGLVRGTESALSAVCGVISFQFVEVVHSEIAPLKESDAGVLNVLQSIPQSLFTSKLFLYIIAFAATAIVVSLIVRYLTNYTRLIAVVIGSVLYLVIMIGGGAVSHVSVDVPETIFGTLGSALIALIINFFGYSVDYRKSKYIQFEDDDYYYYVKAIPKMTSNGSKPVDYYDGSSSGGAPVDAPGIDGVDFETKLENSLKDL
ncbi:MAG: hypothetical protein ACOYBC_05145 [Bilifractor sp.]|jgi:hypothetical protein